AGRAGGLQVVIAALEKIPIRQHRQTGGATTLVARGNRGGLEILADHAFRRRRFLDLGDHRCLALPNAMLQCVDKTPRRGLLVHGLRLLSTLQQRVCFWQCGDFFRLAPKNAVKPRAGVLDPPTWPLLSGSVKRATSRRRAPASPLCTRSS